MFILAQRPFGKPSKTSTIGYTFAHSILPLTFTVNADRLYWLTSAYPGVGKYSPENMLYLCASGEAMRLTNVPFLT